MNPLTNTRNITKLSQRELNQNDGKTSWHDEYKGSAWVFVGGLPYDLTEGDVISIFSQYGEIVNLNLCRDKVTGKSKGFGFICYEDQRSTILAVDNFNAIKILGRTIRVDHVKDYKPPKDSDKLDDITRVLMAEGCGPKAALPEPEPEEDLLLPLPAEGSLKRLAIKEEPDSERRSKRTKSKKDKKSKSKKKKEKKSSKEKKRRRDRSSSSSSSSSSESEEERRTRDSHRHRRR